MNSRRRIPIFDSIIDSCRLLPQVVQSILFAFVLIIFQFFIILGLQNLLYVIISLEILFILILIQKNIVFRNISKIDKAIERKVLWVKTKRDNSNQIRYFAIFTLLGVATLIYFFYFPQNRFNLAMILLVVLFSFKSVFYVPSLILKIIEEDKSFEIIDEFSNQNFSIGVYKIKEVEIWNDKIKIIEAEASFDFTIDFYKKEERVRLRQFLSGVLERSIIKVC